MVCGHILHQLLHVFPEMYHKSAIVNITAYAVDLVPVHALGVEDSTC